MKNIKSAVFALLAGCILFTAGCSNPSGAKVRPGVAFGGVTKAAAVKDMGFGWNLGNTLDAGNADSGTNDNKGLSTETSWGMPSTTQAMIKAVKAKGFKTIRIPVSWHNHITDSNCTIDSTWMDRVQTVVDWAMDEGLYVILNIHHDNATAASGSFGYYPSDAAKAQSEKYVRRVWEQIAQRFNGGYDYHLVFETLNEPRARGTSCEWWCSSWTNTSSSCSACPQTLSNINNLNKIAVDTIRASGGNNALRFIMIPAIAASPDSAFSSGFKIPDDESDNLMVSVHMYTPNMFAMNCDSSAGAHSDFKDSDKNDLNYYFNKLKSTFCDKGYPVVIGEMGATYKSNDEDRKKWIQFFVENATTNGMCPVIWDNMNFTADHSESFGQLVRSNLTWQYSDYIAAGVGAVR